MGAVWRHGDWLKIDPGVDGGCVIYGRSDATINRHGLRMGTSELYSAIEALPEVLDSLVVDLEYLGRPSYMPLFVVLGGGAVLDDATVSLTTAPPAEMAPGETATVTITVEVRPRIRSRLALAMTRSSRSVTCSAVSPPGTGWDQTVHPGTVLRISSVVTCGCSCGRPARPRSIAGSPVGCAPADRGAASGRFGDRTASPTARKSRSRPCATRPARSGGRWGG